MGYSRPLLRTHPARRLAQFWAARVLSWASVPGPSLSLGPRRPEPPLRALKSLLQPRTLAGGRSPHTEGNLVSRGPRTPFSKLPGRRPAGTRGACLARLADGRGLAGLPYSRCQTLSLREGRGLLGCAGSRPMGAVKGVALGNRRGCSSGLSPAGQAQPDPRELLSGSSACGCGSRQARPPHKAPRPPTPPLPLPAKARAADPQSPPSHLRQLVHLQFLRQDAVGLPTDRLRSRVWHAGAGRGHGSRFSRAGVAVGVS